MNDIKGQLELLSELTNVTAISINSLALLNQHKNLEKKERNKMVEVNLNGFDMLLQSYRMRLEQLTLLDNVKEKNDSIKYLADLRGLVAQFGETINNNEKTVSEKRSQLVRIVKKYNAELTLVGSFVSETIDYSNSYLKKKVEENEISKADLISLLNSKINKDIRINIENLIKKIEEKERKNQPETKIIVSENNQNEVENEEEKVENTTKRERKSFSNDEDVSNLDTLDDVVRSIEYDPKHMGAYVNKIMVAICEEKINNAQARIKEIERTEKKMSDKDNSLWDDIKLRSLEHQKTEWYKVIEENEEQLENIKNGLFKDDKFSKYATKLLKKIQKNEAKLAENKKLLSRIEDKDSNEYILLSAEKEDFEEKLKKLREKKDAKIVGCSSSIELTIERRRKKIARKSSAKAFAQGVFDRFKRKIHRDEDLEEVVIEGASEITNSEEEKGKSK